MIILFCEDPIDPASVDSVFLEEAASARQNRYPTFIINHDEIENYQNVVKAIRKVPHQDKLVLAIYRGWMLKSENYKLLYDALRLKNIQLVNSPEEYDRTHYLPNIYPCVVEYMAKTEIIPVNLLNTDAILMALSHFGDSALVIKDYVKSQAQGYWNEACFIPNANNSQYALQVIDRFIELQGDSLAGGLIIRQFIDFVKNQKDEPIEWRVFIYDGKIVAKFCRNGTGDAPDDEYCLLLASRIKSNYFTIDFARSIHGEWILLETGDGQVSGIPTENCQDMFSKF